MSDSEQFQHTPVKLKHSYLMAESSGVNIFIQLGDSEGQISVHPGPRMFSYMYSRCHNLCDIKL